MKYALLLLFAASCAHNPADPAMQKKAWWSFKCDDGSSVRLELSQNDINYKTSEIYDTVRAMCGET